MKAAIVAVGFLLVLALASPAAAQPPRRGHCEPFDFLTRIQCISAGLDWVWDDPPWRRPKIQVPPVW